MTGKVFYMLGGNISVMTPWAMGESIERSQRWTIEDLDAELPKLVGLEG